MSRSFSNASLLAAAASLLVVGAASAQLKIPRVSPGATVTQTVGLTDLTVTYSRPGVKNRVIWGDLVPYDKAWRTGANEATTLATTDEIQLGGQKLAAGTYSLYTIPGKGEWTVVLNSEKDLWGAYEVKPEKDVLRVKVKPTPAEYQEWMQFSFEDLTPTTANLVLRWEKLRVAVPIAADPSPKVLASCRAAMDTASAANWRTPLQASTFCLNNEVALEEGRKWIERSIAVEKNYSNLSLLARWQARDGKKSDAIATAKQAIALAKQSKDRIDTIPTERLIADWSATK
jgi:DUF2911 family protein